MNIEVEKEMKYLISESDYEKLLPLTSNAIMQINYYFDMSDFYYLNNENTVRIRAKDGKFELTIKQKIKDNENGTVSNEYNEGLDEVRLNEYLRNGIDLSLFSDSIIIKNDKAVVTYIGSLATLRSEFLLGCRKLQLDKNQYLGVTDYELEFEYDKAEEIQMLRDFIKEKGIEVLPSMSKAKRFFDALHT